MVNGLTVPAVSMPDDRAQSGIFVMSTRTMLLETSFRTPACAPSLTSKGSPRILAGAMKSLACVSGFISPTGPVTRMVRPPFSNRAESLARSAGLAATALDTTTNFTLLGSRSASERR